MNSAGGATEPRNRGRAAIYLLSGIAVCGVCEGITRIGSQNIGARSRADRESEQPSHYRVYECAGSSNSTGFHVSMRQDYLDQIVADAVLARVPESDFRTPRAPQEDEDGSERRALRLEIKSHNVWLNAVCNGAELRGQLYLLAVQERIVEPKIEAAQARINVLDAQGHLVNELMLQRSRLLHDTWNSLVMAQRRQIIQSLVVPRINSIPIAERGRRGLNPRRVDLAWRE